jgi:hypothetical protein
MRAKVRADVHSVVAWIQHPDRKDELLAALGREGATNRSIEDTFADSIRIRDLRWTTRTGSKAHQRVETAIGTTGLPGAWDGERFLVVGHEVNHVRYATGREETVDCNSTLEFVPTGPDLTEIISIHHHRTIHGPWYNKFIPPNSSRVQMQRELRVWTLRCETAIRGSPGS